MKIIASCHYNRPFYSKQCFEHLSKCKGIENYTMVIGVEPGNQEVIDLCRGINFCDYLLQINETRLGCNKNIGATMGRAFNWADYVIMVEDDILLSPDALQYFEQMECCKADDIGFITGYNKLNYLTENTHKVSKRRWYHPWLWATWRDRFHYFTQKGAWSVDEPSWDYWVNDVKYSEIYPELSRSQNIGAELGVHVPNAQWHRENHYLEYWAGQVELEDKEFICDWNL